MRNRTPLLWSMALSILVLVNFPQKAHASFVQVPFEFEGFSADELDWFDYGDDINTFSTPLGFSVTIGGATYDHFDMDSNGYVQLLSGSQTETNYGYGYHSDLIDADPSSTYLLAAYDDLDSEYYGYFGYKLYPERAIFYYDTETYSDGDYELLNNFEIILSKDRKAQWNFNYADYESFDYDLYSAIYFGNTGTQLSLYSYKIPSEESWLYSENDGNVIPEPATLSLLGLGLLGLVGMRKKLRI